MSDSAFAWPIRVYFEDTDAGGVVFHASYVNFLERARTEWLRARGVSQRTLAAERGLLFAIAGLEVRFREPARLDDELLATCELTRKGGASLEFRQQIIRRMDNAVLADARVRAACLDAASFRPRPLPEDLVFGRESEVSSPTNKKTASR
ncbi:MAG TPA: tol-pal system-associated acyl-CoA thioesterase [Xanthomonadales bacterium]|nr:tol-pal system-associated acyl-CoA thioesterase [Xanthomonadales bacterium]